jgi:hypothetical protein
MNRTDFEALLRSFPRVRDRTYVAADCGLCPVAVQQRFQHPSTLPRRTQPIATLATETAPAAADRAPTVVAEFWSGLNLILAEQFPKDKAAQRAVVAAFEELHFSLLRESNLEEVDEVCGMVGGVSPSTDG